MRVFCNESLSNLEIILQRNLRTDRTIFVLSANYLSHSCFQCVYWSAQKNSGYVTASGLLKCTQ